MPSLLTLLQRASFRGKAAHVSFAIFRDTYSLFRAL